MTALDPIGLQVLAGRLKSICDEMGAVLIRSAHSPNIKERRDCSTALFDARGELVMQAEHIPVHLGSMPDAVAAVVGESQRPGRSWILNDPFAGGTHLPDITVVTPVIIDSGLAGFVASRAHHADVGGPTPGSMPAASRRLEDEGVVIPPRPLERLEDIDDLIVRMRDQRQRRADLRAQLAANETGSGRLLELLAAGPADQTLAGMAEILDYAERRTRARLVELPDGTWEAADVLEGGFAGADDVPLAVRATIAGDELELDFSGSAGQVEGNLNCPLPVTRSAALFAVRALLDPDAPASAGAHRPVRVIAPKGSILNARAPAAVAAGNVETSSRVADLVLGALGEAAGGPAQGQGTMNNVTLAGRLVHLLRDDRRRPGRLPECGRPGRRPRRDVEHAQHPNRGARDRAAASGARARGPPRVRRRGRVSRRRRGDPRDRSPGADGLHAADRAPPPRAAGTRGWRGRQARPELAERPATTPESGG